MKFEIDRRSAVERLREAAKKCKVDVLDYVITSNHIHLVLWSKHATEVSKAMHHFSGNVARDYNRRKGREGAFWQGRYRATLIGNGLHLARCLLYVDLSMVRAGVCSHPRSWKSAGYHEITGDRQRYRVINRDRLMNCLIVNDPSRFVDWYNAILDARLKQGHLSREPLWSEAGAVGRKCWVEGMTKPLITWSTQEYACCTGTTLDDGTKSWALTSSNRELGFFWQHRQGLR